MIGCVAVYLGRHVKLAEWAPTIAAGTFGTALTITFVAAIARRESRLRVKPRVDKAVFELASGFSTFARVVARDYIACYGFPECEELPENDLVVMCLWLEVEGNPQRAVRQIDDSGRPALARAAQDLAVCLESVRARCADVLEPDLVAAIDSTASALHNVHDHYPLDPANPLDDDESFVLMDLMFTVLRFAYVFAPYAPPSRYFEITNEVYSTMSTWLVLEDRNIEWPKWVLSARELHLESQEET